jgi:hypothetical protein
MLLRKVINKMILRILKYHSPSGLFLSLSKFNSCSIKLEISTIFWPAKIRPHIPRDFDKNNIYIFYNLRTPPLTNFHRYLTHN